MHIQLAVTFFLAVTLHVHAQERFEAPRKTVRWADEVALDRELDGAYVFAPDDAAWLAENRKKYRTKDLLRQQRQQLRELEGSIAHLEAGLAVMIESENHVAVEHGARRYWYMCGSCIVLAFGSMAAFYFVQRAR